MLWFKAWRESRIRFLLVVAVLLIMALQFVFTAPTAFPPPEAPNLPYTAFVWGNLIGNRQPIIFAVMALVLGLGGLQRERAAGTAAFTLVLPVTRRELIAVRAAMGAIQVAILALLPILFVALLSPAVAGHDYAPGQAFRFGVLYLSWGLVFFAVGVIWSTLLSGTFSAVTACVLTPFVYLIATARFVDASDQASILSFQTFMSGLGYFDQQRFGASVLGAVFPWASVSMLLVAALVLLLVAYWRTTLQDF